MTGLAALSVAACRTPLPHFERLSIRRDELEGVLPALRTATGADQVLLLSTCERVELYAWWSDRSAAAEILPAALAGDRGLSAAEVGESGSLLYGDAAAEHLLRVAAGLESFVLGDCDIVGQIKAAGAATHGAGVGGLEVERLVSAAVHTSRRVHRETAFGRGARSVAATAVRVAAERLGGPLADRSVVVVGAGQVAGTVVAGARARGAQVTVCNRTRRHADRFAAAGATVLDLDRLTDAVSGADVLIFGTAAPHPLLDAASLALARARRATDLLVLDLCVPRNVDAGVREVPGVTLVDLADLRAAGFAAGAGLVADVAQAERVVEEELARHRRWLAGRAAAASVQRLRSDAESCARVEVERLTRGMPADTRRAVDEAVRRAVRRLAHRPTRALLEAAESGDARLVDALARSFADVPTRSSAGRLPGS